METWGPGIFDNDVALRWARLLVDMSDLARQFMLFSRLSWEVENVFKTTRNQQTSSDP
jgi:hypothetical protein